MKSHHTTDLLDQFGLSAPHAALLKNRNVFLDGETTAQRSSAVVKEFLYIEHEQPGLPITLNICNSPGGPVLPGLSILDAARRMNATVSTVGTGLVASMAAVLLCAAGSKGHRYATKNCGIMVHQPSGVAQGQETDVLIAAENLKRTRKLLEDIIAEASGLPLKQVHELCERDTWLTPEEALELNLIDHIID